MQLALEASASWRKLLIGSKEEGALVVLKDLAVDLRFSAEQGKTFGTYLCHELHRRDDVAQRHGQSDVLRLGCT